MGDALECEGCRKESAAPTCQEPIICQEAKSQTEDPHASRDATLDGGG
jgi:hypothetical protein